MTLLVLLSWEQNTSKIVFFVSAPQTLSTFPQRLTGTKRQNDSFFFFWRDWSIILSLPRVSEVWPNFCIDALAISFFRQSTKSVNAQGLWASFFSFFKGWAPEAHRGRTCEDHAAQLWPGPCSPYRPVQCSYPHVDSVIKKKSLLNMVDIIKTTWEFLVVKYSKCQTQGIFIAYDYHVTRPFALWDLGNRDT